MTWYDTEILHTLHNRTHTKDYEWWGWWSRPTQDMLSLRTHYCHYSKNGDKYVGIFHVSQSHFKIPPKTLTGKHGGHIRQTNGMVQSLGFLRCAMPRIKKDGRKINAFFTKQRKKIKLIAKLRMRGWMSQIFASVSFYKRTNHNRRPEHSVSLSREGKIKLDTNYIFYFLWSFQVCSSG